MIEIRRLRDPEDVASFRAIRLESLRTQPDVFLHEYDTEVEKGDAHFSWYLKAQIFVGAFGGEELVGIVGISPNQHRQRHRGVIWAAYVLPGYRGQHICDRLVATAIDHAREAGLTKLVAGAITTNDSGLAVLCGAGFKTYGLDRCGMKDQEGNCLDVVLLDRFI